MKITIGKPVPIKTNKWQVNLECMSGDADAYHQNGSTFTDEDRLLEYVAVAMAISEAMDDGYARDPDQVMDRIEQCNLLTPELFQKLKAGHDFDIWDMCGGDVTCEGLLASIVFVGVFWYDANGVKHNCEVTE